MPVGLCISAGTQLKRAAVGPASGPTRRLSHFVREGQQTEHVHHLSITRPDPAGRPGQAPCSPTRKWHRGKIHCGNQCGRANALHRGARTVWTAPSSAAPSCRRFRGDPRSAESRRWPTWRRALEGRASWNPLWGRGQAHLLARHTAVSSRPREKRELARTRAVWARATRWRSGAARDQRHSVLSHRPTVGRCGR